MIKCIVIDDEPLALEQMASYVEKTPFLELVNSFESAIEAATFLQTDKIDLMFVDIEMPDLNGIELVRAIANPPKVIFTTAYRDYALEGFAVDAADYLLKPIGYSDFLKAVSKTKERYFADSGNNAQEMNDFIFVKSNYKTLRVNLSEVLFVEASREYVNIYLENEEMISSNTSLKSIEELLPTHRFMRVHRSFIVNLQKVEVIERNRIIFGRQIVPVGNQYMELFQEFCNKKIVK